MPVAGQTNFATGNKSYRIESIRSHYAFQKHQQCSAAYFARLTFCQSIPKLAFEKYFDKI
jgi:hypothetical protein